MRRLAPIAAVGIVGIGIVLVLQRGALDRAIRGTAAPQRPPLAPAAGPRCTLEAPELSGLRIRGGDARSERIARDALELLLRTRVGARALEILRSGALAEPLTLELNARGDNFTAYRVAGRELGETIAFDPESHTLVETERGRIPATPETILAHEIGHAVFKLHDEEDVIREIENPIRDELGLPRRRRF